MFDPNTYPPIPWTDPPLHDAVRRGNLKKVTALIEADPSLIRQKSESPSRCEPLHLAAAEGRAAIAAYLLEHGAEIDARDDFGRTPVQEAAEFEKTKAIEVLVKAGANLELRDRRGDTALHIALLKHDGKTPTVRKLLQLGSKIDLYAAVMLDDQPLVHELMPTHKAELKVPPAQHRIFMLLCLHAGGWAVRHKKTRLEGFKAHEDTMRLLVANGAIIGGALSLMIRPDQDSYYCVSFLLSLGADPNYVNPEVQGGRTPLQEAMINGTPEIVELLKQHGAKA